MRGGLAYGNNERSVGLTTPVLGISEPFSSDKTRWGWTAGLGTEWQFASNWSLKSEVLYARFGTEEASVRFFARRHAPSALSKRVLLG